MFTVKGLGTVFSFYGGTVQDVAETLKGKGVWMDRTDSIALLDPANPDVALIAENRPRFGVAYTLYFPVSVGDNTKVARVTLPGRQHVGLVFNKTYDEPHLWFVSAYAVKQKLNRLYDQNFKVTGEYPHFKATYDTTSSADVRDQFENPFAAAPAAGGRRSTTKSKSRARRVRRVRRVRRSKSKKSRARRVRRSRK